MRKLNLLPADRINNNKLVLNGFEVDRGQTFYTNFYNWFKKF